MRPTERGERYAVYDDFLPPEEFEQAVQLMHRAWLAETESVISPALDGPARRSRGMSFAASVDGGLRGIGLVHRVGPPARRMCTDASLTTVMSGQCFALTLVDAAGAFAALLPHRHLHPSGVLRPALALKNHALSECARAFARAWGVHTSTRTK